MTEKTTPYTIEHLADCIRKGDDPFAILKIAMAQAGEQMVSTPTLVEEWGVTDVSGRGNPKPSENYARGAVAAGYGDLVRRYVTAWTPAT
jgi:hypothetical protein